MSRRRLFETLLLFAVIAHASSQFIDFFQGFNSFLQSQAPRHDVTKRPEIKRKATTTTNRPNYQDIIFFETDEFLKQKQLGKTIDPFATTYKPKKAVKTTSSHTERTTVKPNKINSIGSKYYDPPNTNTDIYNSPAILNREIPNVYNSNRNTNNDYGNQANYYSGKETTQRSDHYNRPVYDDATRWSNVYTTLNPLLNRPGVKPAVVDENRPPITNRPITNRPVYNRPFETSTYKSTTRYDSGVYTPRPTLPPLNTERPYIGSNPSVSGYRPPVSGSNPSISGSNPPFSGSNPTFPGSNPSVSGSIPIISPSRPSISKPSDSENLEPDIEIGPNEEDMSEAEKRRYIEIAEQKCDEYKSANVKKVVALPLAPASQGVELTVPGCSADNVPLIIGGTVADIRRFPHMALVGWKKIQGIGYSWKCGGSLVSEQFILTAGHCTYHDKDYNVISGAPQAVQLGSTYLDGRDATVVQVGLVIRHPKYKLRRSYYDVALLKLTATVAFSERISPACLGTPPPVGDPVIATGWGKTEFGGDSSLELRSVSLPIWNMSECREIWGTSRKLPNGPMEDNQVCAGERKGAKDTCQGDSGGPAQVQDGCTWRVVGITSVGRSCGAPETPALYAKIPRAFISSQVFTNVKLRDNNNQYGNPGVNGNTNNRFNNNGNVNNYYNNNGIISNGYYNNGNNNGYNSYDSSSGNREITTAKPVQPNYNNQRNDNWQNGQTDFNNNQNVFDKYNRNGQNYPSNSYDNSNNYRPSNDFYSNNSGRDQYPSINNGYNVNANSNNGYNANVNKNNGNNNGYNDNVSNSGYYNDNLYSDTYKVTNKPWWSN